MGKSRTVKKKTTRVPRTRNANSMTESQFWGMIRIALRERSRYWKPIALCRKKAMRKYVTPNRKMKYEYQCNLCKQWFHIKDIEVDHIVPVGSLSCAEDLPGFVERLFCEVDKLQVVCKSCHLLKTTKDNEK